MKNEDNKNNLLIALGIFLTIISFVVIIILLIKSNNKKYIEQSKDEFETKEIKEEPVCCSSEECEQHKGIHINEIKDKLNNILRSCSAETSTVLPMIITSVSTVLPMIKK